MALVLFGRLRAAPQTHGCLRATHSFLFVFVVLLRSCHLVGVEVLIMLSLRWMDTRETGGMDLRWSRYVGQDFSKQDAELT